MSLETGPVPEPPAVEAGPRTLAIDVGGTHLKAAILDERGRMISERVRLPTPRPCTPGVFLGALERLIKPLPPFHRVSMGFPGVVRAGVVRTAPNLGTKALAGWDLSRALKKRLGKPARILNDADMQGLAVVKGKGLEFVVTLGTGFGTALFRGGKLMPHLEIGQHLFRKGETYDAYVGENALRRLGKKKWNRRVRRVLDSMRALIGFDRLYIGGGNARLIAFKLDADMKIVANEAGILGGFKAWGGQVEP